MSTTTKPIVYLVDDDKSIRDSMRLLLKASGIPLVSYAKAEEFLEALPENPLGCLLLDVRLPGPSGLELQSALQRRNAELPVIFLTGHADVASSVKAMKAGAVDFLEKPVEPEVLFAAIHRALEQHESRRATRAADEGLRKRLDLLTPQQREVFERIVVGKLNKQIAHELGISERTVKTRRAEIMERLDADSVAELGRQAEQLRHLSKGDGGT